MTRLRLILVMFGLVLSGLPALGEESSVFAAKRAAEDLRAATAALQHAERAKDRIQALSQTIKAYENGAGYAGRLA